MNNLIFVRPHQRIKSDAPLNPDISHDTYEEIFIRRNGQMSIWEKDTSFDGYAREIKKCILNAFGWITRTNIEWRRNEIKRLLDSIKLAKKKKMNIYIIYTIIINKRNKNERYIRLNVSQKILSESNSIYFDYVSKILKL